jgi:DNA ligase-1
MVTFDELAEAFHQIAATSGRRETTERVAALFRQVAAAESADLTILPYLLQGQLGPPFAAPNLGLDERRLAQAIADAAERPVDEVWRLYQQRGDLGQVAAEVMGPDLTPSPPSLPGKGGPEATVIGSPFPGREGGEGVRSGLPQTPTLASVFANLRQIADLSGPGSNERRVTEFARLLRDVGNRGAWALVRIAAGTLRLGVGDVTIEDALSLAYAGDYSLRPLIERAYSLSADLGLVARTLFSEGPPGLGRLRPTPGRPVLAALAERLPSSEEILRRLGPVLVEPKYDGIRIQAQKRGDDVWLFTRRLENATAAFPEIERGLRQQVRAAEAILDGEAVSYDPVTGRILPLQETARRRRKESKAELEATRPIRYYVFDLLELNGADCTTWPQTRRSEALRQIIQPAEVGPIFVAPQQYVDQPNELDRILADMLNQGLEGALAKAPDAIYHAGRRDFSWIKLKREYAPHLADTFDVVIVGYDYGKGRRAKLGIGSLLGAVYDRESDAYRTVTRVATGLSDEQWRELLQHLSAICRPDKSPQVDSLIVPDVWVEPRYVVEVLAGGISRSPLHTCGKVNGHPGYALRFPRVVRLRLDRRPEDATTQAEVIEMAGDRT